MKKSTFTALFLVAIIVVLSIASSSLYQKNINYKLQNRQLILQNDSILSINLELANRTNSGTAILKKAKQ